MWSFLGAIVAALAGAGVTIWSTNKQNQANAAASNEAKGLAMLNRSDTLAQANQANQLSLASLAQRRKEAMQQQQQFQQTFGMEQRKYNNDQVKALADDITTKANNSSVYKRNLMELWGA